MWSLKSAESRKTTIANMQKPQAGFRNIWGEGSKLFANALPAWVCKDFELFDNGNSLTIIGRCLPQSLNAIHPAKTII